MTRDSFHDDAKAKPRPIMMAESACQQKAVNRKQRLKCGTKPDEHGASAAQT
jgi:hypothetical protein